jgi:hypothetical protein
MLSATTKVSLLALPLSLFIFVLRLITGILASLSCVTAGTMPVESAGVRMSMSFFLAMACYTS